MSVENLDTSISACQSEASVQVESASAQDAKLMGILAFMAAAVGLLLTIGKGLESYRWILLVGAAGGVVFTLIGLVDPGDPKSGPDPIAFYNKYGAAEPEPFGRQLIADFSLTIAKNKECIEERNTFVSGAIGWSALAGIIFGRVRALVAILA